MELLEVNNLSNLPQTAGAVGAVVSVKNTDQLFKFIDDGNDFDINNIEIWATACAGLSRWALCEIVNENWHDFGANNEPPLLNGWAQDVVPLMLGAFRRERQRVAFRGHLIPGTLTAATLLFTLPVGYRPLINKEIILPVFAEGITAAILDVKNDGSVSLRAAAAGLTRLILNGVSFAI